MTIGIIGSGALGSNVARALARAGLEVTIANSRGPASLAALVADLGPTVKAGTVAEAASADIVVAAVRWTDAEAIFSALPAWNGRIVVDGTNPVAFIDPNSPDANDPSNPLAAYGIKAIDLGGRHSSEVFRLFVPGARVVKAFNHLDANMLKVPEAAGGKRVLFYSGDDAEAKAEVRQIIEAASFLPVDLGALDVGGPLAQLPFARCQRRVSSGSDSRNKLPESQAQARLSGRPASVPTGVMALTGSEMRRKTKGMKACIPTRKTRGKPVKYDKRRYRIEIMFGGLKAWRRVARHSDSCPKGLLSAVTLAATVMFWP